MKVIAPNGFARDPWVDRINFNPPASPGDPLPRLNLAPAPLSLRKQLERDTKALSQSRTAPRLFLIQEREIEENWTRTIADILLDELEGEPCKSAS